MAEDNRGEHDEHQKSHRVDHQAAEYDQGQFGETISGEQAAYSHNLVGDARLNGRGNGSVKAAVMRQAQQTQGNRALRRAIQRAAQVPVQREGPPAGSAPATPAVAPAAPVSAGNPVVAALWNTSVQQPVREAASILQGRPSKSKIITAAGKVGSAVEAMKTVREAIPAGPANDLTRANLAVRVNGLIISDTNILPHASVLQPIPAIHEELVQEDAKIAELGPQVANTSPTGGDTKQNAQPAGGS